MVGSKRGGAVMDGLNVNVGRGDPLTDRSAGSGTAVRPLALFVLGSARSGTSALTRVLSLCGGTLPSPLTVPDVSNPLNLWEPLEAIDINEAIFYRLGSGWADPTLRFQEDGACDPEQKAACINEIGAFFRKLPTAGLVVIKEPRISVLASLWFEAAGRAGFDVAAVISVRHPQEVIASLATRDRATPELSSALWLKYNLLAERQTRGLPRVFLEYADLLDDWRREIGRISAALAIDLSARDERAIEEFLRPDLRRQRNGGPVTDLFAANWLSEAYEALCAAARDEPMAESRLDGVFEAYRVSEHDFRTAFEDYRDNFSLKSVLLRAVFRPSIARRLRTVVRVATRLGVDPYRPRYAKQNRLSRPAPAQGESR